MSVNEAGQKKKLPTWAWWVVGIVGGLILAGIGYLVANNQYRSQNQELQNQIDELQNQEATDTASSTSASLKTATDDPTADWETYTNEDMSFSVKHPTDWEVGYDHGIVTLQSPEAVKEQEEIERTYMEGCSSAIRIMQFDNIDDVHVQYNRPNTDSNTIYDFLTTEGNINFFKNIERAKINNYDAIVADESNEAGYCDEAYSAWIEHDGYIYYIYQADGKNGKMDKTDQLVLNSFEFTN